MPSEFDSELFKVLGSPYAPDGVVNFESGRVQLEAVYQDNSDILGTLAPRIAEFQSYERFDVLTSDPKDNRGITLAKGCLPQQLGFQATPGRAARLSFSGMAQVILRGDEILQDSGAVASAAA